MIEYEIPTMLKKLAYCYWYEHMRSKGYKLTPKQTQLYENIKHEVMEYGYNYFENHGS